MGVIRFLLEYKWQFIIGWTILTGIVFIIENLRKEDSIIKEFIIRRIEKKWKDTEKE